MEIKFEINRLDIWKFNRFHLIKRPALRNILIINLLLFLYLTVKSFVKNGIAGIIPLIINLIIILTLYHIMKWVIMKTPHSKAGILGEHIIEIDTNGLRESTSVNDNFYKWVGILRILQNKEYIFVYIDNMVAHIIPKRAFEDDREAEGFYQYILDLWNNNKH